MNTKQVTFFDELPIKASLVHFGQCIQTALIYRSSLLIFLLTESFAYAGFIAFWVKAADSNSVQTLYSGLGLASYFVLASFHHAIQDHAAARDIGSDIRLGKLSYALIRPYPFLVSAVIRSTAFTTTRIVLLAPLLILAFALVPGLWNAISPMLHSDLFWQYPMTLILGIACAIVARIVVGMIAFDMNQIWGPDTMLIALYYATSGSVFPVDLAPTWLTSIARWTPTYYMTGFPTLVFMGRIPRVDFLAQWSQGLSVLGILTIFMNLQWRRGIKRFEAIGI